MRNYRETHDIEDASQSILNSPKGLGLVNLDGEGVGLLLPSQPVLHPLVLRYDGVYDFADLPDPGEGGETRVAGV